MKDMFRRALLLCFAGLVAPVTTAAQDIPRAQVVFDRYMSPAAGAAGLLAIQHLITSAEDRLLPSVLGDERKRLPLVGGALYRAGKLIGFDVPQDHMLMVVGHEVFGHGARMRELGAGSISYSFDGPIPYGHGGAATSFSGELPDSPLALLSLEMSGIEAQNVLSDAVADQALSSGRLHYRQAWLYFESRYLGMTYMLHATDHSVEGHDVADFVRTFRDACEQPACTPIPLSDIKRGAKLTLADPMLYYALYGFAAAYIGEGKTTSGMPMIPIGGVRALPSLGFQLTPYGTERIIRTTLIGSNRSLTRIAIRFGDTGASTPWAVDVQAPPLHLYRRLVTRVSGSIWRQPPFLADHTSEPLETGAAGMATVVLPLNRIPRARRLSVTVTAGYKAAGFVPGEQLDKGFVLRGGVVLVR